MVHNSGTFDRGEAPSAGYLGLAVSGIAASAALLAFAKKRSLANFIGVLAPVLMFIGTYQKFAGGRGVGERTLH